MNDLPEYVLERRFAAPRPLVWRSWTEPGLVARWYGPGVETVIHEMDVRPGGVWLTEMRMKKGSGFQRAEYLEVAAPERLVMLQSSTDADWNVTANPMMPDWPRKLLTTVTLAEDGEATQMRLGWLPHEATAAEIACFAGAIDGMGRGWSAGMAVLDDLLAELQAGG